MADGLVLDTAVLIDHRRNHPDASAYVVGLSQRGAALIHPVCAAELYQGAKDTAEVRSLSMYPGAFRRVAIKSSDFEKCLSMVAGYRLSHGVGWADCLIAATCIRLGLPLVTTNDKHFRAIHRLKVIRPY